MTGKSKFVFSIFILCFSLSLTIAFMCFGVDYALKAKEHTTGIVLCLLFSMIGMGCTYTALTLAAYYKKQKQIEDQIADTIEFRTSPFITKPVVQVPMFFPRESWDVFQSSIDRSVKSLAIRNTHITLP